MRLKLLTSVLIVASTLLTACETMTASKRVAVSAEETWALLPMKNLSKTPLAGSRAKALVETHLRAQGVTNIDVYEGAPDQPLMALLDETGQLNTAKEWAKEQGYIYGVTGSVQEWQYKNGLDNEPSVGLTLKFINVQTDEVMWVASASRTGWGYNNLSKVASKTIKEILADVKFMDPQPSRMIARSQIIAPPEPVAAAPALLTNAAPEVQALVAQPALVTEPSLIAEPASITEPPMAEPSMAAAVSNEGGTSATVPAPVNDDVVIPSPYETNLRMTTNR